MITKTVGDTGADYTTWQDAIDDNADPSDHLTLKAITATDLGPADVNMTNANSKRIILTADEAVCFRSGASWPVMADAIAESARVGGDLEINTTLVEVYNLCITGGVALGADLLIGDCIISGAFMSRMIDNPGFTLTAYNVVGLASTLFLFNNGGTSNLYYCSGGPPSTTGTFGVWNSAGTVNCYGCAMANFGFNAYNGSIGGNENVSDDATAPGSTNWQSQTTIFADIANGDLHLNASHDGDYPTSDYTGTVAGVAKDIDGQTRPASADAGADTITVGGGSAPIPVLMAQYRQRWGG